MKEIEKLLKKKNQPKNSKKSVDEWDLLEFKRRLNQDPPPQVILKKRILNTTIITFLYIM